MIEVALVDPLELGARMCTATGFAPLTSAAWAAVSPAQVLGHVGDQSGVGRRVARGGGLLEEELAGVDYGHIDCVGTKFGLGLGNRTLGDELDRVLVGLGGDEHDLARVGGQTANHADRLGRGTTALVQGGDDHRRRHAAEHDDRPHAEDPSADALADLPTGHETHVAERVLDRPKHGGKARSLR
jgi:hypothetical protein